MGQKIQEYSCGKNETVDIDILIASKNDERKNHASYQNKEQTSLADKGVETIYAKKETVGIEILKTSKNGERKMQIMQSIRIPSRTPSRIRMWNQLRNSDELLLKQ